MAPYQTSICVRQQNPTMPPPLMEPLNPTVSVPSSTVVVAPTIQSYVGTNSAYPTVTQPLNSGETVGTPSMPSVPPSPHHDLSRMSESVPSSPVDLMTHRHPFAPFPGSGVGSGIGNMIPNYSNPYQQPKVDMCNQ